jgi:hypothetical protein
MDRRSRRSKGSHAKRLISDLTIHDISNDEVGYDADVEVLKPDAYEEPESDRSEDEALNPCDDGDRWKEELVKHMASLNCNAETRNTSNDDNSSRGRKRKSKDAFGPPNGQASNALPQSQIEVTEVADDQQSRPRPKRARRRLRRTETGEKFVHKLPDSETELEEQRANSEAVRDSREDCLASESSPTERQLDDAMDLD